MIAAALRPLKAAPWIMPALVACLLVTGFVLRQPTTASSGDTIALVHGARTIETCLARGIHSYCDRLAPWSGGGVSTDTYNGIVEGAVAPYPLLQYMPAITLTELGASNETVYRAFILLSLAAFCGLIVLSVRIGVQMGRPWAPWLVILLVTTSPLLLYAGSTFGESLAAFLVALLAVAALRRWPPITVALCAVAACLTKETAFPVLALLGGACLYATPIGRRELRRGHWYGLAAGILGGIAASAAFNWFRYHQLTNYTYGHSFEQVPGVSRRIGLSIALWVAPNGGVAFYWLLAALIAVVAVLAVARRRSTTSARATLALVAGMVFITGTLGSWYSPFGWQAWGPRLMLSMLPGMLLAVIVICADQIEHALDVVFRTRRRAVLLALVVLASALPQVNVLHDQQAVGALFTPDRACPTSATVLGDPDAYYHCVEHTAWAHHLVLLDTFGALTRPWGLIFATAFVAIWTGLVVGMRSVGKPRRGSEPSWPILLERSLRG